jgi:glycerate kinase
MAVWSWRWGLVEPVAIWDVGRHHTSMTSMPCPSIVVAPTAFKGTVGPGAAARAMAAGVAAVWPGAEIVALPLSDGGNGLLEAFEALEDGAMVEAEVSGPLGEPTLARFLVKGATAVVESAEACGLHLVPPGERAPLRGTTRGVGELLLATAETDVSEVILGLGGSATVDGGVGMARALGWSFIDSRGVELREGGGALRGLASIIPPVRVFAPRVVALCDVTNPLSGPTGAARVYGPQKGANSDEVALLDAGLDRLAEVIETDLGLDVAELPGAGAAGGLGAGARAFLAGELVSGAAWMLQRTGLTYLLERADLVVTGEGRFDAQSAMGKVTGSVLEAARMARVRALVIAGSFDGPLPPGVLAADGGGVTLSEADLARLTEHACRSLATGDRL